MVLLYSSTYLFIQQFIYLFGYIQTIKKIQTISSFILFMKQFLRRYIHIHTYIHIYIYIFKFEILWSNVYVHVSIGMFKQTMVVVFSYIFVSSQRFVFIHRYIHIYICWCSSLVLFCHWSIVQTYTYIYTYINPSVSEWYEMACVAYERHI